MIACPGENRASAAGLDCKGAGSGAEASGDAVSAAVRVTALYRAEIVIGVDALTTAVVT